MSEFLIISNANELVRIAAESIVFVASEGNYSDIYTCDKECRTVTLQLGVVEELVHKQFRSNDLEFVRIGKCLIVNLHFVHYINPAKKQIILSDNRSFKFSIEASREALRRLKDYYDEKLNLKLKSDETNS